MATFTALTTLEGAEAAERLSASLERLDPAPLGIGTFEVEDDSGLWEVGGYFDTRPDEAGLALLATLEGAVPFVVSRVEDRDWVAQVRRELTPVEAGRFMVFGGHDEHRIDLHRIGLKIDAAMAFGTGHHGTTLGCLLALGRLIKAGWTARSVADIGTGTGVLAMAAAKTMPARIIASDLDPVAVETARANLAANGLSSRIRCVAAPGFASPHLRAGAPFDLVFANILAGPLKRMAPSMARHTSSGSVLILSGILNRQARGVERVYEGHGFCVADRRVIGEWTTMTLRKA